MSIDRLFSHPLSPLSRRALQALAAIFVVMTVGTVGIKFLAGWTWIDSFYFMAMVATAQGPSTAPPNFWSKIFVAVMAFVSIGTLVTTVGVLFGPTLGYLFHKGVTYAEREEEKLRAERKAKAEKEGGDH